MELPLILWSFCKNTVIKVRLIRMHPFLKLLQLFLIDFHLLLKGYLVVQEGP